MNRARKAAVAEIGAAIATAHRLGCRHLVVHLGVPAQGLCPTTNQPAAARRSVDDIVALAEPAGIRVALEVIPNALSDTRRPRCALSTTSRTQTSAYASTTATRTCSATSARRWRRCRATCPRRTSTTTRADVTTTSCRSRARSTGTPPSWARRRSATTTSCMFEAAGGGAPGDVLRRLAAARTRLDALFLDV